MAEAAVPAAAPACSSRDGGGSRGGGGSERSVDRAGSPVEGDGSSSGGGSGGGGVAQARRTGRVVSVQLPGGRGPGRGDGARSVEDGDCGGGILLTLALLAFGAVGVIIAASALGGGGGGGGGRPDWVDAHFPVMQRGGRRGDVAAEVRVSLADLATEASVVVSYTREGACSACGGAGGSGTMRCPVCGGAGSRPVFGGMMRSTCGSCGGRGVSHAHVCPRCGGSGAGHAAHSEQVRLSAGLVGGDVIRVVGAGGKGPRDAAPGDLVVTLVETTPPAHTGVVLRCTDASLGCPTSRSEDLVVRVRVSLGEALTGWHRVVRHPAGHDVTVASAPGEVTQPGAVVSLVGQGLPRRSEAAAGRTFYSGSGSTAHELQLPGGTPREPPRGTAWVCRLPLVGAVACPPSAAFGTLYVVVDVGLPSALTPTQAAVVRRTLPAPAPAPPPASNDASKQEEGSNSDAAGDEL